VIGLSQVRSWRDQLGLFLPDADCDDAFQLALAWDGRQLSSVLRFEAKAEWPGNAWCGLLPTGPYAHTDASGRLAPNPCAEPRLQDSTPAEHCTAAYVKSRRSISNLHVASRSKQPCRFTTMMPCNHSGGDGADGCFYALLSRVPQFGVRLAPYPTRTH